MPLMFSACLPNLSAAVLAEGVARSKANFAKQELARVKAMSAAQVSIDVMMIVFAMLVMVVIIVTIMINNRDGFKKISA